jgi:hypothetical protein
VGPSYGENITAEAISNLMEEIKTFPFFLPLNDTQLIIVSEAPRLLLFNFRTIFLSLFVQ